MLLDGSQLEVGDSVYHLTLGKGIVKTIEKGTVRVKMNAGGGIKNMTEDGICGGLKLFYWSQPAVIAPEKGKSEQLSKAEDLFNSILEMIK